MSSTTYLDTLILDKVFFADNFELSTSWYAALFTQDPGKAGQLAFEVSAGEYARQAVTLSTSTYSNTNEITYAVSLSSWGTVSHIGLVTADTGGYLGVYGAITGGPISVVAQELVKIAVGGIVIQMP
jgi:hypothetical protein